VFTAISSKTQRLSMSAYFASLGDAATSAALLFKTEWWGAGVVICLQRGAKDSHMVQLMPLSSRHLLLHQNPDWFHLYGAGLPRLSRKKNPLIERTSILSVYYYYYYYYCCCCCSLYFTNFVLLHLLTTTLVGPIYPIVILNNYINLWKFVSWLMYNLITLSINDLITSK